MRRILFCLILLSTICFTVSLRVPLPEEDLSPLRVRTLAITDRHGETLREKLSDLESRTYWIEYDRFPPHLIQAVIAAEDKRFHSHPGIDIISIIRATIQNVNAGRIVSGGSTITQQVIRNIYGHPRTFSGKIREGWYALRLERMLSKEEILEQYLNRVPYGNGTHGIEAAAQFYFGKPAAHLSVAEGAYLSGLPNAPSLNNPYRAPERARVRQQYVLHRMHDMRFLDDEDYERSVSSPVRLVSTERNFRAPHATDMIIKSVPAAKLRMASTIRTTIDWIMQSTVERILRAHVEKLRDHHVSNGAVVIIENETGAVRTLIGSIDFNDPSIDGQVNGAIALRQPGSALKPFTYGLALESGLTGATMLADIPYHAITENGVFSPENYDKKYRGPVLLREALASSYNIPAVRLLERIGPAVLLNRLQRAGIGSLNQTPAFYGLGLTLGNGEVTLLELTNAYAMLARGGVYKPYTLLESIGYSDGSRETEMQTDTMYRVFSPEIAYILSEILSDNTARSPAFGFHSPLHLPFTVAAKTGTTKDYNDNWTVGYTPRYTVGVWVGNFDGTPMRGISGITGSGNIFRDIMIYLEGEKKPADFTKPAQLTEIDVCAQSGQLPTDLCSQTIQEVFIPGTEPGSRCTVHRVYPVDIRSGQYADARTPSQFARQQIVEIFPPLNHFGIVFPEDGAVFRVDPILRRKYQNIVIRSAFTDEYTNVEIRLNGRPLEGSGKQNTIRWNLKEGDHILQVVAELNGRKVMSSPVRFVVH
jgi:penicillin-binding protein 1C